MSPNIFEAIEAITLKKILLDSGKDNLDFNIYIRYSNDTELSKYIWKLKDNKQDFDITWSVLKQSISYTGGSKRCNLCLEEKLCILKDKNKQNLLNKKSEIVSTCNHRKKHLINNLRNGRNACIV